MSIDKADAPPPPPQPPPDYSVADAPVTDEGQPAPEDASSPSADTAAAGVDTAEGGEGETPDQPDGLAPVDVPVVDEGEPAPDLAGGKRTGQAGQAEQSAAREPAEAEESTDAAESQERADDVEATGASPPYADVSAQYPSDYVESTALVPDIDAPHVPPEGWFGDINAPGMDVPGRNNNCGECARAVQSNWAGDPATAAALADPLSEGEPVVRMTDWSGQSLQPASMDQVSDRLSDLGPGSSAVVLCSWDDEDDGMHWFNALNDRGTIKAVDSQSGKLENWPPSEHGLEFDESYMDGSWALYFDRNGNAIQ
jgi:hypothetical protein